MFQTKSENPVMILPNVCYDYITCNYIVQLNKFTFLLARCRHILHNAFVTCLSRLTQLHAVGLMQILNGFLILCDFKLLAALTFVIITCPLLGKIWKPGSSSELSEKSV